MFLRTAFLCALSGDYPFGRVLAFVPLITSDLSNWESVFNL